MPTPVPFSPLSFSPRLVETFYCEALLLSDEVRCAFALAGRLDRANGEEDLTRIAQSSEGLRTTTRMMHAIAWLLNHRAYFMGEISALQLHRHGRLAPSMQRSDAGQLALLAPEVGELVVRTRRFYERLLRLDGAWQLTGPAPASAIARLRERIEQRLVG